MNRQGPNGICDALTSVGIPTGGWRPNPAGASGYYCQSEYVFVGKPYQDIDGIQNLVLFSATSHDKSHLVHKVLLEGRYYRVLPKQSLKQKLATAVKALFAHQSINGADRVMAAIQAAIQYKTRLTSRCQQLRVLFG
jgi:hypothetical protein